MKTILNFSLPKTGYFYVWGCDFCLWKRSFRNVEFREICLIQKRSIKLKAALIRSLIYEIIEAISRPTIFFCFTKVGEFLWKLRSTYINPEKVKKSEDSYLKNASEIETEIFKILFQWFTLSFSESVLEEFSESSIGW